MNLKRLNDTHPFTFHTQWMGGDKVKHVLYLK